MHKPSALKMSQIKECVQDAAFLVKQCKLLEESELEIEAREHLDWLLDALKPQIDKELHNELVLLAEVIQLSKL